MKFTEIIKDIEKEEFDVIKYIQTYKFNNKIVDYFKKHNFDDEFQLRTILNTTFCESYILEDCNAALIPDKAIIIYRINNEDENNKILYLEAIYSNPKYRNRGYFRKLFFYLSKKYPDYKIVIDTYNFTIIQSIKKYQLVLKNKIELFKSGANINDLYLKFNFKKINRKNRLKKFQKFIYDELKQKVKKSFFLTTEDTKFVNFFTPCNFGIRGKNLTHMKCLEKIGFNPKKIFDNEYFILHKLKEIYILNFDLDIYCESVLLKIFKTFNSQVFKFQIETFFNEKLVSEANDHFYFIFKKDQIDEIHSTLNQLLTIIKDNISFNEMFYLETAFEEFEMFINKK